MPIKCLFLFFIFFSVQSASTQSRLPIIKATSKNVTVNDGGVLNKNAWTLSPKTRPDIFVADRTRKTKWVTFYTDIDSIRVKVKPGTKYNFIILLNEKDSCYTQIASAIPPEKSFKNVIITHDTIPFTLTSFNAIAVKAVINGTDTLNLDFDVSSFDFHLTREAILKKTKLLSNQPDALAGKSVPDYRKLNKIFKLQMGSLVFKAPPILTTRITSHEMDGRVGYNVFEGKQVEIDYDHNLLIIHSQLPKALKGYVKSKIEFTHSSAYIKGTFKVANKEYTGNFSMDTGSELAIILDSAWAGKQGLAQNLNPIKTSALFDPQGVKYETRTVLAPLFKVDGFKLTDIPVRILGGRNPTGYEINFLGNDLLKRFNIIIDLKNDYLYLKPNKLMDLKYKESP